ncbi:MAG: response regulator transcription factor [Bacteroidota bacterium]
MRQISILLADDHEIFRKGVAALLEESAEVDWVAEAKNAEEALAKADRLLPQMVLLDVQLPDEHGAETCKRLLDRHPEMLVLAISHSDDEQSILAMLEAGARGYLLKGGSLKELWMAIRTLSNGNSYFSKEVSTVLVSGIQRSKKNIHRLPATDGLKALTKREIEILKYVAEEYSNREIADHLFISPRTVETHKRNLIQKLKVRNTVGLVKYYLHKAASLQERSA